MLIALVFIIGMNVGGIIAIYLLRDKQSLDNN
jgi:hypothetical protein